MRTRRRPQTSPSPGGAARTALVTAASLLLAAGPALPSGAGGVSELAAQCRGDGWQQLMGEDGTLFTSTGTCVSHGARGGTVVPRNGSPTAVDDAVTVGGNLGSVVDVLANDHDPDGQPLTVTVVAGPAHGTATVLADGTVRYWPGLDFAGADSFTYRVDDGRGGADTATVTLTVVPSPVTVRTLAPTTIKNDITIEITIVIEGLPAGQSVFEVRFGHGQDWVAFAPDPTSIDTRVPVTIPRLALAPGTYDISLLTSDGEITTAAVLVGVFTVEAYP